MLKKLLITSLLLLASCSTKPVAETIETSDPVTTPITPVTTNEMRTTPEKGDQIATLKTSMGDIKVFFYADQIPETVKSFQELAKSDKYDDTIFHRVISDFMIQGGDIENMGGAGGYSYKGPGTYLKEERDPSLKVIRGALAMANAGLNTGGSQFFIVQAKDGASWLNDKHTVFGFVYEGMDIVDQIATVETLPGDKPVVDVVLEDVELSTY